MTSDDQQKVSSNNAELFDEIRKYLTINKVQRVQSSKLEENEPALGYFLFMLAVQKLSRLDFSCKAQLNMCTCAVSVCPWSTLNFSLFGQLMTTYDSL